MKISIKIAAVALMLGCAFQAKAQSETASTTATATATVVAPISIAWVTDMNFGNIVATATGGTVTLTAGGARTASGVQLPAEDGTVTAASFTVSGTDSYTFNIILPAEGYTITSGTGVGAPSMTIGTWAHNLGTAPALTLGTATLNLGATLTSVANQVAGIYTNATAFTIGVAYN